MGSPLLPPIPKSRAQSPPGVWPLPTSIRINVGKGNKPGGLWTLDPNTLYFTDGINREANGLFGAIFANGNGS